MMYNIHFLDNTDPPTSISFPFLLVVILFLAYCNSFQAGWHLDDKPNILKNPRIQLERITTEDIIQAAFAKPGSGGFYRPVACLSLALNWFFGKDDVFGYHTVNFFIHFFTSLLLFLSIKTLFQTPRLKGVVSSSQVEFIAALTVLFWALNPMQVQAVTYVIQRMSSLAAMFYLFSFLCYIKGRLAYSSNKKVVFYFGAATGFFLALLSKENAAGLALLLPVAEFIFFNGNFSKFSFRKTLPILLVCMMIVILAGFSVAPDMFDAILNRYDNRNFTLIQRVLTEQRILLLYLSQLFLPLPQRLSIEHEINLSTSLFDPWSTLGAVAVNLLMVILGLRMSKQYPFISFAILFYYLNHLIESTIIPLELIFEHRNYLPSLFLFLPVAQFFNWILKRYVSRGKKYASIIGLIIILFVSLAYSTYVRNKAWKTEEGLLIDSMIKAPNRARPLATLAIKLAWGPLQNETNYRRAIALSKKTLSMQMGRTQLYSAQIGNIASIQNKLGEYKNAIQNYRQALKVNEKAVSIRYNLCKTLIMTGDFSTAKAELQSILDQGYIHADYFNMLGFIYMWENKPETALPFIQKALKLAPGRANVLLTLGKCLSMLGFYERANWFLSFARKTNENFIVTSFCMIENGLLAGNVADADKAFSMLLQKVPLSRIFDMENRSLDHKYREVPMQEKLIFTYIRDKIGNMLLSSEAAKVMY